MDLGQTMYQRYGLDENIFQWKGNLEFIKLDLYFFLKLIARKKDLK